MRDMFYILQPALLFVVRLSRFATCEINQCGPVENGKVCQCFTELSQEVCLICNVNTSSKDVTWYGNNEVLAMERYKMDNDHPGGVSLNSCTEEKYSLTITRITYENYNVRYYCQHDGRNVSHFVLKMKAYLDLLAKNGDSSDGILKLIGGDSNPTFECAVKNAITPFTIYWYLNGIEQKRRIFITSTENLPTYYDVFTFGSLENGDEVSCSITGRYISSNTSVMRILVFTNEVPETELFLSVNGAVVNRTINAAIGKELSIICHALRSSPAANLSWRLNDESIYYEPNSYTKNADGTFDSQSTLTFQPDWEDVWVECVSIRGGSGGKNFVRGILIFHEQPEVQSISYVLWMVMSCCVASLIVIGNIAVWVKRKFRGLQTANLRTNTDFSLASLSPNIFRKTTKEADVDGPKPPKLELPKIPDGIKQPEYAGYDSELPKQHESPDYETELPKKQISKLPALPTASGMAEYSDCEFKDQPLESYSTSLNDVTQAKIFYERDMQKTENIKMGKLYNRWMGTINVPSDKFKCVLFTTLVDEVFHLNKVHWDKFVRRVVQLPKSRNLCRIEGIGIDNAKQYLIHEEVRFNLYERITATSKRDDDKSTGIPISPPEAIRYILGILEGMEVIQSAGFLHPGLCTKKILLTDKRHCQLYDFCLAEDAMNILTVRKPKMTYSLNELAPEGQEKSVYTSASDIWSTANVIWEILSGGNPPFHHDENMKTSALQTPPQTWPKEYQQLSNILLFDCWDYNESLRPSIQELRLSFKKILNSVDTYNLPEVYGGSMAGWYIPMKEAGT